MFRIAERRCLGIDSSLLLADVCGPQNSQSFRISCHDSVLDSVMNHLHKVTCAVRTAVQISLLRRAGHPFATECSVDVSRARGERGKNRVEVLYHPGLTA